MSKNNHVSALDKDLQSMDTSDMFTKAMAAGFYWQKKYLELRDKLKTMPRFTFLSPKEGGVRRYLDKSGNWIERHDLVEHIENTIEFAPEANLQETIRTQQATIERLTEQRDSLKSGLYALINRFNGLKDIHAMNKDDKQRALIGELIVYAENHIKYFAEIEAGK